MGVDSVRVAVRVMGGHSLVEATYWFARAPRALDFTYLSTACTVVGRGEGRRGDLSVAFAVDTNRPWVGWHDTTDASSGGEGPLVYRMTYRVAHAGARRVAIPLVQPSRALDARGARVRPKVHLEVTDSSGRAAPEFPRFTPVNRATWQAAMIAVPSTIVLGGLQSSGGDPCAPAIRLQGESGGFGGRVLLFALTLLLWVPLYFWWASRTQRGDGDDA